MTRGDAVIDWIERYCHIPTGLHVGQPLRLPEFQREIIHGIYDVPIRRAIVSMGRQNGKTLLSACLTLAHVCGPVHQRNGFCCSTALTRDQAALLFDYMAKLVRASPELSATLAVVDHSKTVRCPELGTSYRALSSDAPSQLGRAPCFTVHDELGQVRDSTSPLYDAVESGGVAQVSPLSVIISTQAADDLSLLSRLIDDHDPETTRVFLYTADESLDPFSDEALRAANPGFDHFQNQDELRRQAAAAKRMPSLKASYLNYHLNRRIDTSTAFVSVSVWDGNNAAPSPIDGASVTCGLDLGATHDLCAFVAVNEADGSVHPFFWLPAEGLSEKSRADHAPYVEWAREGHLIACPGSAVSFEAVAKFLRDFFNRCTVRAVGFDPALMNHLTPWLAKAGFTPKEIEEKFLPHRQGYISMTGAVRELEVRLLERKLKHGGHPVLRMCAANAIVDQDASGGRKFVKKKSRGRMDGVVALAMALSIATELPKPAPRYKIFFVG